MKTILLFFAIAFLGIHDVAIAEFKIYHQQEQLLMDVSLDLTDFLQEQKLGP